MALTETKDPKPRRILLTLAITSIPVLVACACCWLTFRSPNIQDVPEAAEIHSEFQQFGKELEESGIEAVEFQQRGGQLVLGLVLTKIQSHRLDNGATLFEAMLTSQGDLPLEGARVNLRLLDEEGAIVESIDMKADSRELRPGEEQLIAVEYNPAEHRPRIVEETISAGPDDFTSFTIYSYDTPKVAPGFLWQISNLFPFTRYEALWTNPENDWVTFEVRFSYDDIIYD